MKRHLSLLGRVLLSGVFISHGLVKIFDFTHYWNVLDLEGYAIAPLIAVLIIVIELGGGIALLVGFYARFFSPIMAVYLITFTIMHYPFWSDFQYFEGFMTQMAVVGGLFIETYAGAGPDSVDGSHYFDI